MSVQTLRKSVMWNLRALLLSAFASGFGLCSVFFAIFTLGAGVTFSNVLRLILSIIFMLINLLFVVHYYVMVNKKVNLILRRKKEYIEPNLIYYRDETYS